jgi:hypothetical protein
LRFLVTTRRSGGSPSKLDGVTPPPLAQRIALGLMHATQVATPFHRPGWVNEEKVDGYRMAAMKAGDGTRLISRTGIQHTKRFPELVRALDSLSAEAFLLDGEVAVYDRALISRFEWLRGRPKDEQELRGGIELRRTPAIVTLKPRAAAAVVARYSPNEVDGAWLAPHPYLRAVKASGVTGASVVTASCSPSDSKMRSPAMPICGLSSGIRRSSDHTLF